MLQIHRRGFSSSSATWRSVLFKWCSLWDLWFSQNWWSLLVLSLSPISLYT